MRAAAGSVTGPRRRASSSGSWRELPTTDVLVVLGGDGTFLRAARAVSEVDVPLLGINLGKVGFLSKVEADGIEAVLGQVASGAYELDERMSPAGHDPPGRPTRWAGRSSRSTTSSSRAARSPGSSGSTSRSARATWRPSSPTA